MFGFLDPAVFAIPLPRVDVEEMICIGAGAISLSEILALLARAPLLRQPRPPGPLSAFPNVLRTWRFPSVPPANIAGHAGDHFYRWDNSGL